MAELQEIEVFRAGGPWHGKVYSDEDIERMAENSNACLDVFQAPLSLNHDEVLPDYMKNAVFGIATKFYTGIRDGIKRLYADFSDVPDAVVKLLKFYPRRSVDLYSWFTHPDNNLRFKHVVKKVSFLGANMDPEVKGLFPAIPIAHTTFLDCPTGPVLTIDFPINREEIIMMTTPVLEEELITMSTYKLGSFLKAYRNAKGFTTFQLAEEVTISESEMEEILSGGIVPSDKTLKQLIKILGITTEAVLKSLDTSQSFMEGKNMPKKTNIPVAEEKILEPQVEEEQEKDESSKTEDGGKVVQTVNIQPSAQGFSQEDVDRLVQEELTEEREKQTAEREKLEREKAEAEKERDEAKANEVKANTVVRHQELTGWYDTLKRNGLPAAFDELQIVRFMEELPQEQTIRFSEESEPVPTIQHFQVIMEKVAEFAKVPCGELPITDTEENPNAESKWKMAVKERMEKFNEDRSTALETVAAEHPEYFKTEE